MKSNNFFKKVRLGFAALVAVIGIGSLSSFRDAQTKTYFNTSGTYVLLPGGASGEGTQWRCDAGNTICTYDQNQQPIGAANQHFVLMDDE